ncbi:phage distal tail protein [Paenibacillus sp. NRS-1760]|uniref:phage distal tail protein n=1 Tax=Paenibacillus sp. NRS-1760 TaxID=3233902 RepID=UPI003D2A455A
MFGGAFNRTPFNRSISVNVYGRSIMESSTEMSASLIRQIKTSTTMETLSAMEASFLRAITAAAEMKIITEFESSFIRNIISGGAVMSAISEMIAAGSRYHVEYIEIAGAFAPGDRIVIDAQKLKVTKNGVITGYNGDFFDFHPESNKITYTDPASGRSVQMRLTFRDKYLY